MAGDASAQSGDHRTAVRHYSEALRVLAGMVDPSSPTSQAPHSLDAIPPAFFFNAADSYAKTGDYGRADTLYQQTAALLPAEAAVQKADVFGKRAMLAVKRGDAAKGTRPHPFLRSRTLYYRPSRGHFTAAPSRGSSSGHAAVDARVPPMTSLVRSGGVVAQRC